VVREQKGIGIVLPVGPNDGRYIYGEHALGAGYIHSLNAAESIYARGWWNMPTLALSNLGGT
jgi:hypothetical protein